MIEITPLSPESLVELGEEMGGCDFTDPHQQSFLSAYDSCDVQAAPGNGKTTLLVAKLALLSRSWTSRTQGVCVISHTNVAREEVEKKLYSHPSASAFLGYPHYIGTVTGFIDRFIALPYLRGLGWSVQRIDDDVFSAVAGSRWRAKSPLVRYAQMNRGRNRHALMTFVEKLELDESFECGPEMRPSKLKVRHRRRQPRSGGPVGDALQELKAEITNDGYYRFADMTALAYQAIEKCPQLVDRIRKRFPLVLLDEAQDTNGAQLALLERLFGHDVAYQKLGDQNQTLYEDENLTPDDYWKARNGVIPLNKTRRFGGGIAAFASRLTVRAAQQIEGKPDVPDKRHLILFDEVTISGVIPAYAGQVHAHWGERLTNSHEVWAVASRHNPTRDKTGGWPKTLIDYCPDYRSGRGRGSRPDTLCGVLRQASLLMEAHGLPGEIVELVTSGLVELLRRHGGYGISGERIGKRNLWSVLATPDPCLPLRLRRLVRDQVLCGEAAWDQTAWEAFCHDLTTLLGIDRLQMLAVSGFLEFVKDGNVVQQEQDRQSPRTVFAHDGILIKLGSIHSVKGKTVDSLLVVETEVWRGQALHLRAMDLETVLPHAFGVENRDFSGNVAQLAAATNIFVATTRPRQLLACALRKNAASGELLAAARSQGWEICDLTEDNGMVAHYQDGTAGL